MRIRTFPPRAATNSDLRRYDGGGCIMKRIVLTLVLGVATLGLMPAQAHAQFGFRAVTPMRVAQRQVISWYQAYLGRLPNAQELNILSNLLLTGNNSLYVQSLILSSNEAFLKAG